MENHWACNGYALDLRLLRGRKKDKASLTSLRTGLLCVVLHLHWWLCQDSCRSLLVLEGDHCLVWERHRIFFPLSFCQKCCQNRQAASSSEESLATLQHYLPSHHLSSPSPCLHTRALRWPGWEITLLGVTAGDTRERYLHVFKLSEEDPTKLRTQFSGLRNRAQIRHCISYIPPHAAPTRQLCYCCSKSSLSLTQTWFSKT